MNTVWLRLVGTVALALCGLAGALLIWVAGSRQDSPIATVWQTTGIAGLFTICALAYGCSSAVLWNIRCAISPAAVRILTFGLTACALPFVFLVVVLAGRFFYGV